MQYVANLKSTLSLLGRLIWRTYFPGKGSMARLTPKRFVIMTVFIPVFCVLQTIHWIGLILDELFFRGYRQIEIKEPLFIVGIPRTGTTFLHQTLAKDTDNWTTLTLWELILAPSISERMFWLGMAKLDRFLGRPITKLYVYFKQKSSTQLEHIHQISYNDPEEDFMILIPILACFLLIHPFPFPELWRLAFFDEQIPEPDRKRIMTFYKSCLQRHLYVNGPEKRLLVKNASFCPMICALKETFPDCKIIFTVRNPLALVPSFLSTMTEGARLFDNNFQGHQFRDQVLEVLRYFHHHMFSVLLEWPQNLYIIITMEELTRNIKKIAKRIYDHFNIPFSPSFERYLTEVIPQARKYISHHRYSLAEFDLSENDIYKDFSEIFARFSYEFTKEET